MGRYEHEISLNLDIERYFLETLQKSAITQGIGDDGVVLANLPKNVVLVLDLFSEGVHFKREWFSYEQIGYKALMVNISDVISMGAVPKYALLGVTLPKNITPAGIRALIAGIKRACLEFGVRVIGGDTIVGQALSLSVSLLACCAKPLYRVGARKGDLIMHTGTLGSSYQALHTLLRGGKVPKHSKFYAPQLKACAHFMHEARSILHVGMDISDGLFAECNRLSKANRLAFKINKPLHPPHKRAFLSGEEYEMLLCLAPRHRLKAYRLAQKHRLKLRIIGCVQQGQSHYRPKIWHA
ncbi:thiamine-phosphate kinase [Helicobacter bizzozeronii]|uniref:thiamine-phosphate kinase n=1 Tax=Helicobacter bizzozeronii TaxID=56877 RepID=UPI00244D8060|nr:thiamine-phosphate kinase [Helicobacter bizzozeronii]GMB92499.1 thiamine-phosphate kinase [Helicobacter bizzozeronii]